MTYIQHQKFLLKYQKYCSPYYLKIALQAPVFLIKKNGCTFCFSLETKGAYYQKDKAVTCNYKLSNSIKNFIPINENNVSILAKRQRFITNSLKGILLVNFPEKEKNFLIKNLAAENKIPLITQSASLLLKDSRNMDDLLGVDDPIQILFDKVKTCIPCICFINNLDRIGKQRYEQKPKSLHWLNYSISLLINHSLVNQRETQADDYFKNRQKEIIKSKPVNKAVSSTSVSTFGSLMTQRPAQMGHLFDKQISEADFDLRSSNSKLMGHQPRLTTSYYHRFPTWLCNFRFISHYKTNLKKPRWFSFYNTRFTPPKLIFYRQSSASVAWKLYVFDKSLRSPIKINFFQTLSRKNKLTGRSALNFFLTDRCLVSKKLKSESLMASVSMLKTQTPFIISRLKQQKAEKKSLRFLSISDRLYINSLYSRLSFINCFEETKQIRKQKPISIYDSYKNSNGLIFQNFLIEWPVKPSNNFEIVTDHSIENKSKQIPKINMNFMAWPKKKKPMIAKEQSLISLNGFNNSEINGSFLRSRFKPLNRTLGRTKSRRTNFTLWPPDFKLDNLDQNNQTKPLISKQSYSDKDLKVFFSATLFDNAQARSRILFKRVLTKDTLNPRRQTISFKTNRSLIKNKRSATSNLLSRVMEDNKNNSCELDR